MPNPPRKIAFIVAATDHGTLILNRHDQHQVAPDRAYGVGFQLLERASHDQAEVDMVLRLLDLRRHYHGNGVVAIDCGANIGVHTVDWAKRMTGWGTVVAIEAQERIYYALAGNLAINNCLNAKAIHAAVTNQNGTMKIPEPDYLAAASFGSLELKKRANTEFIGQSIDYSENRMVEVRALTIDSLKQDRVDLIKMDVEGMEIEALEGGAQCLRDKRPILMVEVIKTDKARLRSLLENLGYSIFESGMNCIAVHATDKTLGHIKSAA
jgi:FkbM family methyltransferase